MKKLLILFIFIFLFGDVKDILKQIPKNSPEYSLGVTLAKEIKSLKPEKIEVNLKINNEKEYIKAFNRFVDLKLKLIEIENKIKELNNKLSILASKQNPTSKLQYLYYQKVLSIQKDLKNQIYNILPVYKDTLLKKLKEIDFNKEKAKKNIEKLKKILKEYTLKIDDLNINLQRYKLLNDNKNVKKIENKIKLLDEKLKDLYFEFIKNYEIIWFYYLKNKDKEALKIDSKILYYAKLIDSNLENVLNEIITDFEKEVFGSKIFVYGAKRGVEYSLHKFWEILNYPLFKVSDKTITSINFFLFVLVLIIGWFIGKYYKKLIYQIRKKYEISYATSTLLANMGYYAILTLSFLISLKMIGLDLSSLAIIAGALSVGIGFGLQNIVSNFVSGIILMFERSIKVGDYIQIDENTRGEIVDISMRSTVIRTNDNIDLIIPNQTFIQNNVINWTLGDDIVRFRVPFGVAYGSDIDKVERVVLNALEKSKIPYIKKSNKYDVTPRVIFLEMGDSSLNFELFVWVRGEYAKRPRRTKSEFLKMIYKALNEAGIEIPFPQQDLHIRDSVPFEIKIDKLS